MENETSLVLKVSQVISVKFLFQFFDRQDPSSNHDQVEAGFGVPKAHSHSILIGGRACSILIGGQMIHPHQNWNCFFSSQGIRSPNMDQTLYSN